MAGLIRTLLIGALLGAAFGANANEVYPGALEPAPVADASGNYPQRWKLVPGGGFPPDFSHLSGAFTATPKRLARTRVASLNFTFDPQTPLESAFETILSWHGIRVERASKAWETLASPTVSSKREFVSFGRGHLQGKPVEYCATVLVPVGNNAGASSAVLSAAPEVFRSWDGPLVCAQRSGYLLEPGVLPDKVRDQIAASASYDSWAEIYTSLGNMKIQSMVDQYVGLAQLIQQDTVRALQQVNQQMTEQTGCLLTPGCAPYDLPLTPNR